MELLEFCRGRWGKVVYATELSDVRRSPELSNVRRASEFFESLSAADQTKMSALFHRFAEVGEIRNREKFKKIADDLFEFKSGQVRMFCFLERSTVVITHGCIKKRDDLNKAELERASRIRSEHRQIHIAVPGKAGAQRPKK